MCGRGIGQVQRLTLFNQGADPVDLPPLCDLRANAGDDFVLAAVGNHLGHNGRAPRWQLVDHGDVQVRVIAHGQCAWNGRGTHHQHVRLQPLVGELLAQGQALRHAKAVLLVNHRQGQVVELHLLLNHGMRADHQRSLATGHQLQHGRAFFFLLRTRQPGDLFANRRQQRLQPAHELGKVLLRQNFRGSHQRTLPAGRNTHHGGHGRHHGFARAHITLQQAVHGNSTRQVLRNLAAHTLLRTRQAKRQLLQKLLHQCQRARCGLGHLQHGGLERGTLLPCLVLRQLLGQQLFRLQALPRGVGVIFQRSQCHIGRGVVQKLKRLAQSHQGLEAIFTPIVFNRRLCIGRQGLRQLHALHGAGNGAPQIGLRQACRSGVDGRERLGQIAPCGLDHGVHHLSAPEAPFDLAANAQRRTHGHAFLLRGVEAEKGQHASACAVIHRDFEHAARAQLHFAVGDRGFNLHRVAIACIAQQGDPGFIFVTQGQVQHEVDIAHQPQFLHGLLRRAGCRFLGRRRRRGRHESESVGKAQK